LLVDGMEALGLKPYLERKVQAPIIVTFHAPADPRYDFKTFYQAVKQRGYILYPGKLTEIETFRVGCIGHFGDAGIPGAVKAIGEVLTGMGVEIGPAVAA
jgi:2-aminoethylphosphonate-pyruvate transaminase